LHASAVAFVTGHENPAKAQSALDWEALARFPGTLVVYMGMARLGQIAQTLVARGKAPDTPAAVIEWGSTSQQRTVEAPLHALARAVEAAGLHSPGVIVIGSVAGLRPQLAWFERRPLFGRRVLVTRPRHQANDLVRRLEQQGAVALALPLVEIRDPPDWSMV